MPYLNNASIFAATNIHKFSVLQRGLKFLYSIICWRSSLSSANIQCVVVYHQVVRSRISDVRVWRRACDYLGLINEPPIASSVLGPSRPSHGQMQKPGSVKWSEGATKMIAHIPFYILGEQEGQDSLSKPLSLLKFLNSVKHPTYHVTFSLFLPYTEKQCTLNYLLEADIYKKDITKRNPS